MRARPTRRRNPERSLACALTFAILGLTANGVVADVGPAALGSESVTGPAPVTSAEGEGERPVIGLVLGGGSARGLAHVGAIKALEAMRIPVDVVVGSSMGAVVGGLYAAGYPPDSLERIATQLDWNAVFDDRTGRRAETFRRKSDDFGFLTDYRVTFADGALVLPRGVIQGQSLSLELATLLGDARSIGDFDELPVPFRAVAMDLSNGEEVILDSGDLASAVLASMSLPGLLPPVERDGRQLIDGGFVDNLPVSVARDSGADRVIVVDVGSDPLTPESIRSFPGVLRQTQMLMMKSNIDVQRASIEPDDFLLRPALDEFGFASFGDAATLLARGEAAVLERAAELAPLALDESDWRNYLAARRNAASDNPRIDGVLIDQDTHLADEAVRRTLDIAPGEMLDRERLARDIDRLYASGLFDTISYDIAEQDGRNVLTLHARSKASGEGFYRFGVSLESNLENRTAFHFGVSFTEPQLNQSGGEYRLETTFGDTLRLRNELYQPFGSRRQFFVEPHLAASRDRDDFFDDEERRRGESRLTLGEAGLSAGILFDRWGELRVGLEHVNGKFTFTDDTLGIDDATVRDSNLFIRFTTDTLDTLDFPTAGTYARLEYARHGTFAAGELVYESSSALLVKPMTRGANTLTFVAQGAVATGADADFLGTSSLGGFLSLSGYANGEISGTHSLLVATTFYRRLNARSLLFDMPLYAGASLEAGNVFANRDAIDASELVHAGSVFAGIGSPIGPVFIGYGRNDADASQFYFSVGSFF